MNSTITYDFKAVTEKWSVLKILLTGIFIFSTVGAFAQERVISGTVIDNASGEGLPGATVTVKGTTIGTITDIDGNFQLSVGDEAVLIISFVGYKNQEVVVGNQTTINVTLVEDIAQLAEVVVVGYGTQEAKDVTGVVATVSAKEFNRGAIASPDNLISGKVAGVVVTPSTEPGGTANIRIRGQSSIGASSDPLIVVDGVILDNSGYGGGRNGLNFINPSDIETVTVLKDASSAAIYGSRGAAGVILITTKSGKDGKTKLTYDGFYSISNPKDDYGFLSPSNFRAIVNNKAPQILPLLGEENTKWVDEVLQPVTSQNHNISLTGGNNKMSYSVSINHMINNGVIKNSQNKITRGGIKLSTKALDDKLKITFQQRSSFTEDNFSSNVTGTALTFDPSKPIYDPSRPEFGGYWEWNRGLAPANPVSTIDQTKNLGETRRNFSALNLEFQVPYVEGLTINTIASADYRDGKSQNFNPKSYLTGNISNGYLSVGVNTAYTYNFEPYINFKKNIESIHSKFEIMGGYSYQEVNRESYGYSADSLNTDIYGFYETSALSSNRIDLWRISPIENHLQAFYGRFNYSYKDKYLFTTNFRYDGSTKFGPANRYGIFPSVALGWRVLEESFTDPLKGIFTDLKLRVGWGKLGNQQFGDYLYEKFYYISTIDARYQFGNQYYSMIRPTGVDPGVQWETTTTTNFGIDFGVLDNRITGTIDVYNKVTSDLLANVAVAAFTNVSDAVVTNVAEMTNKGIELDLNAVVMDRSNFDWNVNLNLAMNKNKITKLQSGADENDPGIPWGGISGDVGQTIQVLKVGQPFASFYTWVRDPNGVARNGERYQDVNGDNQINEDDLQIVGNPAPDMTLGITSNMRYKNFDLNFTLRGSFGNEVYNNTASANGYYDQLFQGGIINNIHESALETNYQGRQLHSDYYVENGSFLRLDNITLSYNYNKLDFVKAIFYTTVQNLVTLSGYSGPNPEVSNGIDNNLYPLSTTYIFGVSLNF